jgi:hypothetical protein
MNTLGDEAVFVYFYIASEVDGDILVDCHSVADIDGGTFVFAANLNISAYLDFVVYAYLVWSC